MPSSSFPLDSSGSGVRAEQSSGADGLQRPLRSRFRRQVSASVRSDDCGQQMDLIHDLRRWVAALLRWILGISQQRYVKLHRPLRGVVH
jgi:hypothetical protein